MATQKLNIDIVARDRTKQALGGVQGALGRLKKSVFSLQSAFIGLGTGLVIRNLVNTGKNLENLRTRLKFLLKDTNEGAKAFDNMVKFASKVPFSLEEIQSGSGILATVTDNANDLQKMLEITGNVAAVTGLDFRTASEQIQRSFSAGIGAADLFREKGVRNMLGFKAGATVSIEDTIKAFERVFGRGGRFGKATDELAQTFEGTLSMIGDKVFNFKKVLLEAGFFEELKNQFGDLDKFLAENAERLDEIATSVGKNLAQGMVKVVNVGKDLIPTIQKIGSGLNSIFDGFMKMPEFAREVGIVAAFLFGKKGVVGLAAVSAVVDKITDLMGQERIKQGLVDVKTIEEAQLRLTEINNILQDGLQTDLKIKENKFGQKIIVEDFIKLNKEQLNNLKNEKQELETHIFLLKNKSQNQFEINRIEHDTLKTLEKQTEKIKPLVMSNRENFEIANKIAIERIEKMKQESSVLENLKENYKEFFENFNAGKEIANTFQMTIQSITQGIGDAIAQTIVFGKSFKETFGNIARNILARLISSLVQIGVNMVLNATIGKKLQAASVASGVASAAALSAAYATPAALASLASFGTNAIPAQSALMSTVALSNVLSSVKKFEKGGAVAKGQPVLVGERGAEMFIPNQTGQITQSARGTGGGAVNVNFNINTLDASGFEDLLFRSRGTITQLINSAVNERGRESLI